MKKKLWFVIPLYWVIWFVYGCFLPKITSRFKYYDFTEGSSEYHFGACSFSITLSLVVMLILLIYVIVVSKRNAAIQKGKTICVALGLAFSFALQVFIFWIIFHIFTFWENRFPFFRNVKSIFHFYFYSQ